MASSIASQSYSSRIANFDKNEAAKTLLEIMERKQTNLCVSVDVTTKKDLLDVVKAVADVVALVKTHIDIVEDFDQDLVHQLSQLSKEHDFLIFEDRKFADIGNTVSLQYSSGVHKIASWSHITDAHLIPGSGIITGLAKVGEPLGRGLLLLAEMSSAGNLATGEYTKACVQEAERDESGYVMGFIAMGRVDEKYAATSGKRRDFLILTPGVGLDVTGDSMGQQYRTPEQVIGESGCDVMIVGRGIYGALMQEKVLKGDVTAREEAVVSVKRQGERYKQAGWQAYLKRIGAISVTASKADIPRNSSLAKGGFTNGNGHSIVRKGRCRPYAGKGVSVVFAYGSLIFKPPPHTIGRTVGYVKGYARRFAQSSNDHRGTPAQPGRVVTLVCASQWHSFISNDDTPEGDVVWGVAWTIDPTKSEEVREYLDHREKNGYTPQSTEIYQHDKDGNEIIAIQDALIYVGLPDNEAFVGPATSLKDLAEYIYKCQGPSGRNDDYVLKLAAACRALSPDVLDSHLFTLERLLLDIRKREGISQAMLTHDDRKDLHKVVVNHQNGVTV